MRFYPVPLYVTVPKNSAKGAISSPLIGARQIVSIEMTWPANTNLGLIYQFFLLGTPPSDLTANPGAGELTQAEVQTGQFVGESVSKEYPFDYPVTEKRNILEFFATNNQGLSLNAGAVAILQAD